jgi:tetratricopeptide repeat protein
MPIEWCIVAVTAPHGKSLVRRMIVRLFDRLKRHKADKGNADKGNAEKGNAGTAQAARSVQHSVPITHLAMGRDGSVERTYQTENRCSICGVDLHDFSALPDGVDEVEVHSMSIMGTGKKTIRVTLCDPCKKKFDAGLITLNPPELTQEERIVKQHNQFGANHIKSILEMMQGGRLGEAETVLSNQLAIIEKEVGRDNYTYVSVNGLMASIHEERGDYDAARAILTQALSVTERKFGPRHSRTSSIAFQLVETLLKSSKDWSAAVLILNEYLMWMLQEAPTSLSEDQQMYVQLIRKMAPPTDS